MAVFSGCVGTRSNDRGYTLAVLKRVLCDRGYLPEVLNEMFPLYFPEVVFKEGGTGSLMFFIISPPLRFLSLSQPPPTPICINISSPSPLESSYVNVSVNNLECPLNRPISPRAQVGV